MDRDLHPDSAPKDDHEKREDVEQATKNIDDAKRGEVRDHGSDGH